jgi:hypothetical protein
MTPQQLRQMFFVDGDFARLQRAHFALVVINAHHLMPDFRKTRRCYKTHVPRTDNRNPYRLDHSFPSVRN